MSSILVIEGEESVAGLLKETQGIGEYRIVVVLRDEDAVQFALRETPSLIIIDLTYLGVDGYEILQRLRDHPKSVHVPIIVLSAHHSLADKVRALELGADGYISKPFAKEELLAHVRRQLRRIQHSSLSPLTQLPGGLQVERAINYKLNSLEPWSILHLDLGNFKAFNDAYGFFAGNNMILLVGNICQQVTYDYGNPDDFVGHIGGDDFVITTMPDRVDTLCRHILTQYKKESRAFYRQEDLERGSIKGLDRKGRSCQFPLVSLSIGVVSNQLRCSYTIDEIGTLMAEAKCNAKRSANNVFHISSQWNASLQDSSCFPPPPSSYHPGHKLIYFSEEDVLAEFK